MAMTFRISTILSYLLLLNFNSNLANCNCEQNLIAKIENQSNLWNLKICYLQNLLNNLEKAIYRSNDLLNKWQNEYTDLEYYINNCAYNKRLDSANYRLYRWIYITDNKLFRESQLLEKELKQTSFEITTQNLTNQIECFFKSNTNNCGINTNINFEQIHQIRKRFYSLQNRANQILISMDNFRSQIQERSYQISVNQCCWY